MSDISKLTLLDNQTYDLKDSIAREHIQDHNNPHQVTAKQAGAISRTWDYSFRNASGWYRFLTINTSASQTNSILLLVQDTYSYNGSGASYKAIISFYMNRTSTGGFGSSANLLTGYGFTKDRFYYTYDSSSGDVSIYVSKTTNNIGTIGVTVISSLNRLGNYVDLSDSFESTAIATLPEGGWYFQAIQDGAGNIIPDTYATKDELLSTLINKGAIDSSTDIDILTVPGMWYSATGLQPHWPSQGKPGRLVVFGSNSTTMSRKVQLVVCNTNAVDNAELYYRIGIDAIGTAWGSWTRVATEADFEYLIDEVTGDFVTFETESAQVLPSVVVDIDPIQDLHGYDYPWPAGGGKNLLPNTKRDTSYQGISYNPRSDGGYDISGTLKVATGGMVLYDSPDVLNIPPGSYRLILTGTGDGLDHLNIQAYVDGSSKYYGKNGTFTVPSTATSSYIRFRVDTIGSVFNCTVYPMLLLSTETDSTFAPYSNICPISGWDGCTVERVGKNLIPFIDSYSVGGLTFKATNQGLEITGSLTGSSTFVTLMSTSRIEAGTYTFHGLGSGASSSTYQLAISTEDGALYVRKDDITVTYNQPRNMRIRLYVYSGAQLPLILPAQLERGSTATPYEPYQNSTYSISFPSSAGTVYGGTLDVTNGMLMVDRATTLLNATTGVTVGTTSGGINYADITYAALGITLTSNVEVISSDYKWLYGVTVEYGAINTYAAKFRIYDSRFTSVDNAKAVLATVQVVYPLATPVTYQLTPTQVTALLGQNNLWADTGDSTVIYRTGKVALLSDIANSEGTAQANLERLSDDLNDKIDSLTATDVGAANDSSIAPVEPTSTASTSYAVGDCLMLGGVLYEVTSAIASGETIAQGTNVTPVTVMESMEAMDVRLSNELAESNAVAFGIPYEGVDLTVKFADEISQYSDPWEWIHNRIVDGNWTGLHIGDYIPFTTTEATPRTYQAQIAGINTYTYYGDIDVGRHIDFICRTLWRTVHPMNPVDFNNGTKFGDGAAIEYPWLASDLYLWLNSLGGVVPNATTAGGGTGELVDYSSSGVLYYLPAALKRQIVEKRAYLPKRYNSSELRSDDNGGGWVNIGWLWLPSEFEVYGAPVWGGKGGYSTMGNCVQYPIFAHNMNRVKTVGGAQAYWWVLSVYSGSTKNWCCVYANGLTNYTNADNPNVFVPVCFRIK